MTPPTMPAVRWYVATDWVFGYQHPWPLASRLVDGRVAFWRGVRVVEE